MGGRQRPRIAAFMVVPHGFPDNPKKDLEVSMVVSLKSPNRSTGLHVDL